MDKIIIEIDGVGRVELDASFANLDQAAQQKIVNDIAGYGKAPAETQRVRAAAQGLTFGLSDEIAAAAQNPISAARAAFGGEGEDYYKSLESERAKLAAYKESAPVASTLYEMGGAMVPALLATPFTGGGSVASTAPMMARAMQAAPGLAKLGAASGAAYGFGTAEGGMMNRAAGAVGGGLLGAATAPIVGAATMPIAAGAKAISDIARSKFGNKAGKAVEAELQRLASGTGLTVDEIAERVARGEIMAENETLRMATRALMAEGGAPEAMVRKTMSERPTQLRNEAMQEIQSYLAPNADTNVPRVQQAMEKAARSAEREAYENIPGAKDPAPDDVVAAVRNAVTQFPGAAKELRDFVGGTTRSKPFFSLDGEKVTVGRIPTLQEAEITRRFLNKKTSEAYRAGSPMGEVYKSFEDELRGALDAASPSLANVRADASVLRRAKEAFDYGRMAFSKGPDEFEIFLEGASDNDAVMKALQAGVMASLRRKASQSGGTSLMGRLANENTDYGMILRSVFPQQSIDSVLSSVEVAAQSQAARGDIIKGSSTALAQAAGRKSGSGINAEEAASALRGNPIAIMQVGQKLARELAPGLDEAQRTKIVEVLLSQDPQMVTRALRDDSGAAMFGQALQNLAAGVRSGITGAAVAPAGIAGGQAATGLLGMR